MKKGMVLHAIGVIMENSLKTMHLKSFAIIYALCINFHHLELHKKNRVVERNNRSIQEMARTMINENSLSKCFWAEAVNAACYVLNRVLIRPHFNKTPYEL